MRRAPHRAAHDALFARSVQAQWTSEPDSSSASDDSANEEEVYDDDEIGEEHEEAKEAKEESKLHAPDDANEAKRKEWSDLFQAEVNDTMLENRSSGRDAKNEGRRILFMDVEYHRRVESPLCQVCVVSLDRTIVRNFYVFEEPLHPHWQAPIDRGIVECDAFDDPRKCRPLDDAFLELLDACPRDSVLVYKGHLDMRILLRHLSLTPRYVEVFTAIRSRGLRHAQVDRIWKELSAYLDADTAAAIQTRGRAPTLQRVYDNLLWRPVLVHLPSEQLVNSQLDARYAVHPPLPLTAVLAGGPRIEFLHTSHLQPSFHTAHTDALVMRTLTLMVLYIAEVRHALVQKLLTVLPTPRTETPNYRADQMAFLVLATHVARETQWLRARELMPTRSGLLWLSGCKAISGAQLVDVFAGAELYAQGDVAEHGRPRRYTQTLAESRQKRLAQPGALHVFHDLDLAKVYDPLLLPSTRDAFRVRALRNVVPAVVDAADAADDEPRDGENVFDWVERQRRTRLPHAAPIGDRPWYYYPRAAGQTHPGVQLLHTRWCAYEAVTGVAPNRPMYTVQYYDLDAMTTPPPGMRLRFCKECKLRKLTRKPNSMFMLVLALVYA